MSNYLYMSSVDSDVIPTASACCFPSAITATTWPFSTGDIRAPGEVRPGHMILAPLSTKRMAPLSTCCIGRKKGSENIMEKLGTAKKLASMKSVYILLLLLSLHKNITSKVPTFFTSFQSEGVSSFNLQIEMIYFENHNTLTKHKMIKS